MKLRKSIALVATLLFAVVNAASAGDIKTIPLPRAKTGVKGAPPPPTVKTASQTSAMTMIGGSPGGDPSVLVDQISDRTLWNEQLVVGQVSNSAGPGYDGSTAVEVKGNGEKLAFLSGLFGTFDTQGHPNGGYISNFTYKILVWESIDAFIEDPFHRNPATAGLNIEMMPSNSNYLSVYGQASNAAGAINLYRMNFDVSAYGYVLTSNQTYLIAIVPKADFFSGMGVIVMSTCAGGIGGSAPFWFASEMPYVAPNTYAALGAALPGVAYRIETAPFQTQCIADADHNGIISVQDIFTFLNLWFSGSLDADANHDGVVTVQDIFDFLNLWFAGGC